LRYLANQYAPNTFWPPDPAKRAQVDKWAEWFKLNIALQFTAPVFWRVVRTPPSKRDPIAIDNAELTLADIQFGHCLFRYYDIDITRRDFSHIRRYYDDLTIRPAFRQYVMVSYDELK